MVWLDLDDTLFDHSYSVAQGLETVKEQYRAFASHPTDELARLYNIALNEVYPDYLSGAVDFQEMRRRKFVRFCAKLHIAERQAPDVLSFHRVYDEAYARNRRATPGSADGVQFLVDHGIEIRVLTNGIRTSQTEKLRIIGFDSLVPYLLTSEEAGVAKPDARIFQWALQRTGKKVHEVVMIGDNPINDIAGALNAGIPAIYYSSGANENVIDPQLEGVPVMTGWAQLPELLAKLKSLSSRTEAVDSVSAIGNF